MLENMKPIPGYKDYFATKSGDIFSTKYGRSIKRKPGIYKDGYRYLDLCVGGKVKTKKISYLVLLTFVGERPKGYQVCHNDGNPSNDNLSNLRWDTPKNNIADRKIHGTMFFGEDNSNAKLTYPQVEFIKKYPIYRGSHTYLAKHFNVSRPQISNIIHGRQWQSNGK